MTSLKNPRSVQLKPGLAVVCAVKNRIEPLVYTIPTWLQQPEIKQIVLVDWDSKNFLWNELDQRDIPGWPDPRVVFVRAANQPQWCLAKAFNLAFMFVQYEFTFKADSDVICVDSLAPLLPVPGKTFVTGDWKQARNKNETSLNGSVLLSSRDFRAVGGYDERFHHYGWDDDDLYQRLENRGLRRETFPISSLFHLPHSDQSRTAHQDVGSTSPKDLIQASRQSAHRRSLWDSGSPHSEYSFKQNIIDDKHKVAIAFPILKNR